MRFHKSRLYNKMYFNELFFSSVWCEELNSQEQRFRISDRPPQHDLQISELNHSWTHVYMDLTELIITRSHEPNTCCWPTLSVLKVYLECDMFTVYSSMWHRVNGSYSHVVTTQNWTRGNKNRLTCFYNFCKYIVTFNPQKISQLINKSNMLLFK